MDLRKEMEIVNSCICQSNALYSEWAKQHGITYNMLMILCTVYEKGVCTQKQIAEEWLIPKQTVHTIVKELERRGYVRFRPGRDQKEKKISFTESGQAYAEEILEKMFQMEDRVMERMGPEMRQALIDSSQAFTEALADEVRREA